MIGTLYGVSVGPGDPELMTLKSVKIINQCDVIAVPQTKSESTVALSIAKKICDISDKTIVPLEFLMTRDENLLTKNHHAVANTLYPYLDDGKNVAFLNIGDISTYSTFSYIAQIMEIDGYNVEICPGVTSFCAAAAVTKKPLVQGRETLSIMSADSPDFDTLLAINGTKVIMKSGKSITEIKQKILGMNAYAVENCGYKTQKIYNSAEDIDENCGYFTTIILRGN